MSYDFKTSFKKATETYLKNKDFIENYFVGELYPIELINKDFSKLLDYGASTDIIYKDKEGLVYGVALRINFNKNWHNHVTIRYSRKTGSQTEYEKSIKAFNKNAISSVRGIQLDVDENNNAIRGIIYDRLALFKKIESNLPYFKLKHLHTVKSDGNEMLYFKYDIFNQMEIIHKIFINDKLK